MIYWSGNIYRDGSYPYSPAISPAASDWQGRLTAALSGVGRKVLPLSSMDHRAFPFGPLIAHPNQAMFAENAVVYPYLNLPLLKTRSIARSLVNAAQRAARASGAPEFFITYNAYPEHLAAGPAIKRALNARWVVIVADSIDLGLHWERFPGILSCIDGIICLSHAAYVSCPKSVKLHLDGGIELVRERFRQEAVQTNSCLKILYSGSFERWGGLSLLLDALSIVPKSLNFELHVAGHGRRNSGLARAIEADTRVKFHGTLSHFQLNMLCREVNAFINPRPNMSDNKFNFPSKLLHYLAFGKPIISTRTPGVSNSYDEVLLMCDPTPKALAEQICRVVHMPANEFNDLNSRILKFVEKNTWETKAVELSRWLDTVG